MREGVIQFELEHHAGPLRLGDAEDECAHALLGWRQVMVRLGMIGRDPARYEGLGFGNVSARVPPWGGGRGRRPFLITGSQTGGVESPTVQDLTRVGRWDRRRHAVTSRGVRRPSSESLTHAALYDVAPTVRFVFHGHAPVLWRAALDGRLGAVPTTGVDVGYGTPEMAEEIHRLWKETRLSMGRFLVMAGHEDGVVGFGRTGAEAIASLVEPLGQALAP